MSFIQVDLLLSDILVYTFILCFKSSCHPKYLYYFNPSHVSFDDDSNFFRRAEEPLPAISARPFEGIERPLSFLMIFQVSESS